MKYNASFPDSQMLYSCSYDSETKELTVTFRNGKDYTYVDVDKSIFDTMQTTSSVGRYFNSIKGTLKIK